MVDLCVAATIGEGWEEDVLKIDGKNLSEAFPTCRIKGIGRVICSSPCVGTGVSSM